MLPIDYLSGARRDFDESFDWYAERNTQVALRFVAAVDAALQLLASKPLAFASPDGIHRECQVERFPFRIVYRVVDARILIVAIAHARRRPGYWRREDMTSVAGSARYYTSHSGRIGFDERRICAILTRARAASVAA